MDGLRLWFQMLVDLPTGAIERISIADSNCCFGDGQFQICTYSSRTYCLITRLLFPRRMYERASSMVKVKDRHTAI